MQCTTRVWTAVVLCSTANLLAARLDEDAAIRAARAFQPPPLVTADQFASPADAVSRLLASAGPANSSVRPWATPGERERLLSRAGQPLTPDLLDLLADVANRHLLDPVPGQDDIEAAIRRNRDRLDELFPGLLASVPLVCTAPEPSDPRAVWRVMFNQACSVDVSASDGQVVGYRLPHVGRKTAALSRDAVVAVGRRWLHARHVASDEWTLATHEYVGPQESAAGFHVVGFGKRSQNGVWLPADLMLRIGDHGLVTSFSRREEPLSVSLRARYSADEAAQAATKACGGSLPPLKTSTLYVRPEPPGRDAAHRRPGPQRLYWSLTFGEGKAAVVVRVDAHTAQVCDIAGYEAMPHASRTTRQGGGGWLWVAGVLAASAIGSIALRRRRQTVSA